ncbi:MAG: trypsin-like peptidase domain-containing protein [Bdellovibrionales bacterium]|nr:trypsin-like peptidase domain-containing protein [Bdellovibrionales bacterium]
MTPSAGTTILFSLVLLVIQAAFASASEPDNATSNLGFHPVASELCQISSESARRSTFRMILPGERGKSVREVFGDDNFEIRERLLFKLKARREPPPSTDDLNIRELEICLREKFQECRLFDSYRNSSIVLIEDGTKAFGAAHVIQQEIFSILSSIPRLRLETNEGMEQLRQIQLLAFIYDSQGNLVGTPENLAVHVDNINRGDIASLKKYVQRTESSLEEGKLFPPHLDLVTLKIDRALGPGINISTSPPIPGEDMWQFGFPRKTSGWKFFGGLDSDGNSFYCSRGKSLDFSQSISNDSLSLKNLSLDEDEMNLMKKNVIFISASGEHGMSGGPLLNAKGELIAIHSGSIGLAIPPMKPLSLSRLVAGQTGAK